MKTIFYSLCLLTFLSSTGLVAETTAGSRHVGVGNYYKLGSKENPVTANEYCAFLNSDEKAAGKVVTYGNNVGDCFYDRTFMNYDCMGGCWFGHYSIKENDCITRHCFIDCNNCYDYAYSVISGRGDFIIDGLLYHYRDGLDPNGTRCFVPMVLNHFNDWRKNPKAEEICNYINAKLEGQNVDPSVLLQSYLQSYKKIFIELDPIIAFIHANNERALQHTICDEKDRVIIKFYMDSDDISFHEGPIHAVVEEGMEYYRPSTLKWKEA